MQTDLALDILEVIIGTVQVDITPRIDSWTQMLQTIEIHTGGVMNIQVS